MRKCGWLGLLALSGCVLAGCVSTIERSSMPLRLHEGTAQVQVLDDDIKQVLALRPQLTFPCRIAVYLMPEPSFRWTGKDKELVETWGNVLKREGIASDVFLMTDMFATRGGSLKELRVSAAKHGADALFVVQGATQSEHYCNPASILNLTLVGGFIIPASHCDSLFVLQGGLVDVHNGYLYASLETEGEGKIMRPSFTITEKDAIDRAKQQAMDRFGGELLKRLRGLHTQIAPPAQLRFSSEVGQPPRRAALGSPND
jgi:hypothetical protein